MGLVTCSKCKKVYDYGKYDGICPKCARYNKETTASQDHQEYHNKYDGGYSHNAQDDHHSYHQRYDSNKNPHGSQLEGVQQTLQEIMSAEYKVDVERKSAQSSDAAKKAKILIAVVLGIFLLSLLPLFGPFIFIVIIWVAVVLLKRKGKK